MIPGYLAYPTYVKVLSRILEYNHYKHLEVVTYIGCTPEYKRRDTAKVIRAYIREAILSPLNLLRHHSYIRPIRPITTHDT